MIRLATIGTSAITDKFLTACRSVGGYTFKAAYSRNKSTGEAFALKWGFESFSDNLNAVAADPAVDAVYIASPNIFHYEQSRLFLENGKNVICEKPIVTKAEQFNELSSLARKNGLIYMEAMMSRHSEGRKALKAALNEIGEIEKSEIIFFQRSSRYDSFLKGENPNIFNMSLAAGTLMDLGVYCVYAVNDLFGYPLEISASAEFLNNGADGAGRANFKYNGFEAQLSYSKIENSSEKSQIIGRNGIIKIGSISKYTDISVIKDGKDTIIFGSPSHEEVMCGEAEKFKAYLENFDSFEEDYREILTLCKDVHSCMDLIKQKANIKYPV